MDRIYEAADLKVQKKKGAGYISGCWKLRMRLVPAKLPFNKSFDLHVPRVAAH